MTVIFDPPSTHTHTLRFDIRGKPTQHIHKAVFGRTVGCNICANPSKIMFSHAKTISSLMANQRQTGAEPKPNHQIFLRGHVINVVYTIAAIATTAAHDADTNRTDTPVINSGVWDQKKLKK